MGNAIGQRQEHGGGPCRRERHDDAESARSCEAAECHPHRVGIAHQAVEAADVHDDHVGRDDFEARREIERERDEIASGLRTREMKTGQHGQ